MEYVGGQAKVAAAALEDYLWSGRSIKYHREQVRAAFGFREFARGDEDKLAGWLAGEVCPVALRDPQLREGVLVRCRAERIEPPGRVDRIIGSARAVVRAAVVDRMLSRLDQVCVEALECLVADEGTESVSGRTLLAELKADPGQVGLETLLREIDKLATVRAWGLPPGLFSDASEKLVEAWRARAARSYPSDLRAPSRPVRLTLLAALCTLRASEITDALVPRHTAASAYLHEKAGDLRTAARLHADAARSAPNLAERHHLTRQAARISQALRG